MGLRPVVIGITEKTIRVRNECDDPEINAMALRMNENDQNTALAAAIRRITSLSDVHINRVGGAVTSTVAPVLQKNNKENLPKDCEDIKRINGIFSWKAIARYQVPYITRVINGEELKFVSVRMTETQLLSNYIPYLHADIFTCTSVRSHIITDFEAQILNEINIRHCDGFYGKDKFCAGKDYIIRLEDVHELYTFIEICYKKLQCNNTPSFSEKCGFICINSESVMPYSLKDGHKYVPLFYFEGETENLRDSAVKLENWDLAYLKFCCRVQGVRNELYTSDSCAVTSLDNIKNYFPPDTQFRPYWPANLIDTQLLINQKSTHVNPSGVWIRTPLEVPAPESTIPHTLTASAPVMPRSMPEGPSMFQDNSLMNGGSHVIPPSPLVSVNNTAPVIANTVSYSNAVPISQCMTTMYNPVPSSSVMSHSNQMQQFYNQCPSYNSRAQQQQVQQHQQQQQQQQQPQPQQQQQIITTPLVQPYSGSTSVQCRLTNTQQRNTLRNGFKLKKIPERTVTQESDSTNNPAYKIQKAIINGKVIRCINANPYIYSDLMVALDDFIKMMLPSCTVERCTQLLYKYFDINLLYGNSEQVSMLLENGRPKSKYDSSMIPMVMLQDITHIFSQLKNWLSIQDQFAAGPSKRHHTS
ncbi:hypothetical protein AGLY_016750 [Aphis glycines]|uniref:Uncharacterized protein n=1 Tax=Aphis glycines TaxID=307491 RepID=A0A6G0SWV5_APHGL|nr:hypothetical protein AGLY_016750 [Aphis glycines]